MWFDIQNRDKSEQEWTETEYVLVFVCHISYNSNITLIMLSNVVII